MRLIANIKLECALFEVRTVLAPEISRNRSFLFDSRVLFEGTMSIKVRLIKNILITESTSAYALINEVRLTTREYGICTLWYTAIACTYFDQTYAEMKSTLYVFVVLDLLTPPDIDQWNKVTQILGTPPQEFFKQLQPSVGILTLASIPRLMFHCSYLWA